MQENTPSVVSREALLAKREQVEAQRDRAFAAANQCEGALALIDNLLAALESPPEPAPESPPSAPPADNPTAGGDSQSPRRIVE